MTGQVKLLTAKEVLVMTGYKSRTTLWRRWSAPTKVVHYLS